VITFDDLEYTFNGKGEFVLVHVDSEKFKFDVQGRFEQLPDNIYGPVRATTLTSVVSRDNTSTVIEVRLRPRVAQWRYRLDVFADGKRVYFDRPALKVQHFHGKLSASTLLLFLLLHRCVIGLVYGRKRLSYKPLSFIYDFFNSFPYRCDRLRAFLRFKPVRDRGHVSIWRWIRSIGKQRIHDYSGVFAMAVYRKYILYIFSNY